MSANINDHRFIAIATTAGVGGVRPYDLLCNTVSWHEPYVLACNTLPDMKVTNKAQHSEKVCSQCKDGNDDKGSMYRAEKQSLNKC